MKTDASYFNKDDLGKIYPKQTFYTVMVEQHVPAKDKDEADKLFLDGVQLTHSKQQLI